MAKLKISSIFSSRAARIALVGATLFAAPNVWLGLHTDRILDGVSLWEPIYLERRLAEFEDCKRVQVIVVGNSHAMASLRPHQVAEALGLPAGSVFSFALPGASAWEMRHLVERFSGQFPNARRVICSVDPYLLVEEINLRALYLSRRSWLERLDYSHRFKALETKTRLLAGWFVPIADYNLALKNALKASPVGALRQFITLERQAPRPGDFSRIPYAWGVPLPHDHESADLLKALHRRSAKKAFQLERADHFLGDDRDLPRGLSDLDNLLGTLRARFSQVYLVESPLTKELCDVLKRRYAARIAAYERGLDALEKKHGLVLRSPGAPLSQEDFYDLDHLSQNGGRKYLRWLAAELTEIPSPIASGASRKERTYFKAKQANTDAWDFGPGYDREENLKSNLEFMKTLPAEMLQERAQEQ